LLHKIILWSRKEKLFYLYGLLSAAEEGENRMVVMIRTLSVFHAMHMMMWKLLSKRNFLYRIRAPIIPDKLSKLSANCKLLFLISTVFLLCKNAWQKYFHLLQIKLNGKLSRSYVFCLEKWRKEESRRKKIGWKFISQIILN
jgi:hypothetical protein